jgi:hypothetical protein
MFSLLSTTRWSRRWTAPEPLAGAPVAVQDAITGFSAKLPHEVTVLSPARGLQQGRRVGLYGVTLLAAALGACASVPPPPTPQMTRAESAIEQARRAGADQLAKEPLREADTQLAGAKAAVVAGDNVRAAALVEEAYADAWLADITAQSVTSAKAAAEVDTSIRTLERETTRKNSY